MRHFRLSKKGLESQVIVIVIISLIVLVVLFALSGLMGGWINQILEKIFGY